MAPCLEDGKFWIRISCIPTLCRISPVAEELDKYIIINDQDTRGVMVINVSNGHGETSSNPGQGWLDFT